MPSHEVGRPGRHLSIPLEGSEPISVADEATDMGAENPVPPIKKSLHMAIRSVETRELLHDSLKAVVKSMHENLGASKSVHFLVSDGVYFAVHRAVINRCYRPEKIHLRTKMGLPL